MPEWYGVIVTARYARMSAPEFLRLPMYWQEIYEVARVAEIEAANETVTDETAE